MHDEFAPDFISDEFLMGKAPEEEEEDVDAEEVSEDDEDADLGLEDDEDL